MSYGACCNQRVVGTRGGPTTGRSQSRRHGSESARGFLVESNCLEIGLGLLQMGLTCGTLRRRASDVRSYGQLSERDGTDDRDVGQAGRIVNTSKQNDRRRVEHAPVCRLVHSEGSRTTSISRRNASGLTRGSHRRRSISSAGPDTRARKRSELGDRVSITSDDHPVLSGLQPHVRRSAFKSGRNPVPATHTSGLHFHPPQSLWLVRRSTRPNISPPLLRSSRTVTVLMPSMYHR